MLPVLARFPWLRFFRWRGLELRLCLRLFGRKIFFVDVDDLYLRAELAIAAEENFIAGLLGLPVTAGSEFHYCARRQQVFHLIDLYPLVINQFAGRGNRKTRIDLLTD